MCYYINDSDKLNALRNVFDVNTFCILNTMINKKALNDT